MVRYTFFISALVLCCYYRVVVSSYKIGLVVKTTDNEFFQLAEQGCNDRLRVLNNTSQASSNSTCIYVGPVSTPENWNPDPNGTIQAGIVQELLNNHTDLDGLAISVQNAEILHDIINTAAIPIITFDSDAPDSNRIAYVGTDNYFLGETIAKVAQQISPEGGTYAGVIANDSPNNLERLRGFRDQMNSKNKERIVWQELSSSPVNYFRNTTLSVSQMEALALEDQVTVIGAMVCGVMWSEKYEEMYNRVQQQRQNHELTFVCADDFPLQIDFLSRGKVQGLVGQMPYEMGYRAASVLLQLINGETVPEIIGTNLITHLQVPLVLPELIVKHNLLGNLRIVGYVLFGMIAVLSGSLLVWTIKNRSMPVVRAAQPFFLILLIVGVFIMATALIPLSFDDGAKEISSFRGHAICMSVPWVTSCGFTITYAALYSKTYRITRIMNAAIGFHRVTITPMDVLRPMLVLFTLNIVFLTAWTIREPLTYERHDNPGADGWNRILSTYGACRSDGMLWYALPLMVLNTFVLLLANRQAYVARKIKSEFAESKYIALAMATYLQALLIGLPVSVIVRDSPQAFYLTVCFLLFVVCVMLLLLIFIPKLIAADADEATQIQLVHAALRRSSVSAEGSNSSGTTGMRQRPVKRNSRTPTAEPEENTKTHTDKDFEENTKTHTDKDFEENTKIHSDKDTTESSNIVMR